MEISKEKYLGQLKYCHKGKHKFRTNKYGVTWCVRCGLLGTDGPELSKEEIITVALKRLWHG